MLRSLRIALSCYSQLPGGLFPSSNEELPEALPYWPAVGAGVALLAGGVLLAANALWTPAVAAVFCLAASALATGAMHEDGFADACDGYGGGWDREAVLRIMQDSSNGAFGVLGLMLLTLSKWSALVLWAALPWAEVLTGLLVVHWYSRWSTLWLVRWGQYARREPSKLGAALGVVTTQTLLWLALFGLAALWYTGWQAAIGVLLCVVVSRLAHHYFEQRTQGYTGDGLGAVQQLCELLLLLALIA